MSIPGIPRPAAPARPVVDKPTHGDRGSLPLWIARGAAFVALGIAIYLAYASLFAGGKVAGCGDDTQVGCGHVLSSRWSSWLGIPVGVPAVLVYLIALSGTWLAAGSKLFSQRPLGWAILAGCAVIVGGAAIWFTGLQLLSLGNLCWYCLTLHACGLLFAAIVAWQLPQELIAAGRPFTAPLAAAGIGATCVATLVVGQLLVTPARPNMKVTTFEPVKVPIDIGPKETTTEKESQPKSTQPKSTREPNHPWGHRRLSLLSGGTSMDIYDFPVIGDREAAQPLVEVFDYTCPHCRELFEMLEKIHADYGKELTLVLLPIPMNSKCNKFTKVDSEKHATACELTRTAIALWQAKPEVYAEFHRQMMKGEKPPSPEAADKIAEQLVGKEAFQKALADPAVEEQLAENCRIYSVARDNSRDGAIPKLMYNQAVSSGLPASEEQLRQFLEEQVGLKRASAAEVK